MTFCKKLIRINKLKKNLIILAVSISLSILLASPAKLVAQDESYSGLNIENGTLFLWTHSSIGLTWQFDLLKDETLLVSKTGIVTYNTEKEGVDYWLDTYKLFNLYQLYSEGNYTATLQILDGADVIDGPYSLNFNIFKPEGGILNIVFGLPGEITIFNLFAKNSNGLDWEFSLIDNNKVQVYSDFGQVNEENWWHDIAYTLSQGSYTAYFDVNDTKENIAFNDSREFVIEKQPSLPEGKIVFISDRDGNNEVYIMNTDGSEQKRLTNTQAEEEWPSFSPDGSKIAFMSNRDGNFEIYIMNADGSEQINLTNNPKDDSVPSFSPDGSKIVFESTRDGNGEIYIMNIDGSEQINLTNTQEYELGPYISPDGTKIAYRSDHGASGGNYKFNPGEDVNWEIYIMNTDGSEQTRLTNNQVWDWEPHFSPDGSKIVYVSVHPDQNDEIYIMNADGSGQTRLTSNPVEKAIDPSFLPDGSKIAFASSRNGNSEIYIMNTDGSEQTRLTNNPANDREPCFFFDDFKVKAVDEQPFRSAGFYTPDYTTHLPTFIDTAKTEPKVIYANVLLAILTMIPFAVASELFKNILSENEEDLKRKIRRMRPVAYLERLNKKIKKSMDTKMDRHLIARNIAQLSGVILFYGLANSLLDPTWKPFSIKGLVLFIEMALAYGILGFGDDIMQRRALKKWGVDAGFSVQPKNLLVSAASISASRLFALVPGIMFGAPVVLKADKTTLGIAKRDKLSKISLFTFLVIGSVLWLMTTATYYLQKFFQSGALHDVIGEIEGFLLIGFAVALQNTFIQMLGLPGGFGYTMRQRNRWVWFIGLVAVTFVFYVTLINPRRGLVEALQKNGVILFLSIAVAFMVVTFGLWLHFYFRKKHKLP